MAKTQIHKQVSVSQKEYIPQCNIQTNMGFAATPLISPYEHAFSRKSGNLLKLSNLICKSNLTAVNVMYMYLNDETDRRDVHRQSVNR